MNLNDPRLYKVVIFKRTNYYQPKQEFTIRDVMFNFTKDGVKPNLGIQEIFLLDNDSIIKLREKGTCLNRDEVRLLSAHSFTIRGYRKIK